MHPKPRVAGAPVLLGRTEEMQRIRNGLLFSSEAIGEKRRGGGGGGQEDGDCEEQLPATLGKCRQECRRERGGEEGGGAMLGSSGHSGVSFELTWGFGFVLFIFYSYFWPLFFLFCFLRLDSNYGGTCIEWWETVLRVVFIDYVDSGSGCSFCSGNLVLFDNEFAMTWCC